jgi:hypothetical protein
VRLRVTGCELQLVDTLADAIIEGPPDVFGGRQQLRRRVGN